LWELAEGHLPFVEAGQPVTMPAVLRRLGTPIPPARTALAEGVARLLARRPADRPADAAAARAMVLTGSVRLPQSRRRAAWWLAGAALAAASAIGLVVATHGQPSPRLRTVTGGDEGIPSPPAFADSKSLVFESNRSGSFQIWTADLESGRTRQITDGAFERHRPQVVGEWLYTLRGAAPPFDLVRRRLADPKVADELVRAGVSMASVSTRGDIAWGEVRPGDDLAPRIRISDGAGDRLVADASADEGFHWLAWSSDGTALALVRSGRSVAQGAVDVVDAATGMRHVLSKGVRAAAGLAWDGPRVLCLRGDSLVSIADGDERVVIAHLPDAARPSLSPGGVLAFVSDRLEYSLWLYAGHEPLRRVTFLGTENAFSPTWATEHGELAFLADGGGAWELRVLDGDSAAEVGPRQALLADVPYVVMSPDGRHVALPVRRGAQVTLGFIGVGVAGEPRALASVTAPASLFPSDFYANDRIGYVVMDHQSGKNSLWDVGLREPHSRLILDDAGGGFHSTDGVALLFSRDDRVYRQLLDSHGLPSGVAQQVPGGRKLLSYRFLGPGHDTVVGLDEKELVAVDMDHGEVRHLAWLPPGTLYAERLAAHPDGRVAVSLGTARHAIVVVDNYREIR
jgi:hypothetical protein